MNVSRVRCIRRQIKSLFPNCHLLTGKVTWDEHCSTYKRLLYNCDALERSTAQGLHSHSSSCGSWRTSTVMWTSIWTWWTWSLLSCSFWNGWDCPCWSGIRWKMLRSGSKFDRAFSRGLCSHLSISSRIHNRSLSYISTSSGTTCACHATPCRMLF